MAAAFAKHRCDTRQAGQLYAAWRDGSPLVRKRILAEPELFLKAQRQVEPKAPSAQAAALLRDLEMVSAIMSRASRRVAGAGMDRDQGEDARRKIDRVRQQLDLCAEQIHIAKMTMLLATRSILRRASSPWSRSIPAPATRRLARLMIADTISRSRNSAAACAEGAFGSTCRCALRNNSGSARMRLRTSGEPSRQAAYSCPACRVSQRCLANAAAIGSHPEDGCAPPHEKLHARCAAIRPSRTCCWIVSGRSSTSASPRHPTHAAIEPPAQLIETIAEALLQFRQQPALLQRRLLRREAQRAIQHQRLGLTHRPEDSFHRVPAQLLQRRDALVAVDDQITVGLIARATTTIGVCWPASAATPTAVAADRDGVPADAQSAGRVGEFQLHRATSAHHDADPVMRLDRPFPQQVVVCKMPAWRSRHGQQSEKSRSWRKLSCCLQDRQAGGPPSKISAPERFRSKAEWFVCKIGQS